MKRIAWILTAAIGVVALLDLGRCSSETISEKEYRLAHTWCSSCHLFPEPALLTKTTWLHNTLPEMAFRMGLDSTRRRPASGGIDLGVIPARPMITKTDWALIKDFYFRNSPDSLPSAKEAAALPLSQFSVTKIKVTNELPLFCLVQIDTATGAIYAAGRNSWLYKLNDRGTMTDSFRLPSPPSHLVFETGQQIIVSSMGIMDPNDEKKGQLFMIDERKRHATDYLDSLQRPVYFEKQDFDGDHRDDYLVCEFGNYTGALNLYQNLGNNNFLKHTLLGAPGARRVLIRDVNHDGKPDIVGLFTQGNELISLFKNTGNFNFEQETLLRFPPVNGSSFIDLVDFNGDGREDILYTNGDNFDYSPILKPYHGVHIFLQGDDGRFSESWFHTLYGASMALARDFDGDGDIDIAAISFFPDFAKAPEKGFVYFEKQKTDFVAHTTPLAKDGRWLVMDAADIDHDGDQDIVLGALDFRVHQQALNQSWTNEKTGLLILRNNLTKN